MKRGLIRINKTATKENTVESYVCFKKFVDFLEEKVKHDKSIRVHFYRFVLDELNKEMELMQGVTAEDSQQYDEVLQLVSSIVLPLMDDENETLVALTAGLSPVSIYSTEAFSKLFDPSQNLHPPYSSPEDLASAALHKQVQYDLLLQKIYRCHLPGRTEMIRSFFDEGTGLYKYYRLHIDSRFLEVKLKSGCSAACEADIADFFECGGGSGEIETVLPLNNFIATGFCIVTLVDVTEQQALEQLSKVVINIDKENAEKDFLYVQRLLQTIIGSSQYQFGIMPFLTINNRAALLYENYPYSILVKASADAGIPKKTFSRYINHYLIKPGWIDYIRGGETNLAVKLQQALDKKGICFYGLAPVYFNDTLVGILETGAGEGVPPFNDIQYSKLKPVIPYISQLLKMSIDNFNIAIDRIVKDRFTVIQSSVQWKFNEAAWHYFRSHDVEHLNTPFEKIGFKNVYPLYGAVDIRNSTIERNNALREDLHLHLNLLIGLLQEIAAAGYNKGEELLITSDNWLPRMNSYVSVEQELKLNNFLFGEIDPFLKSVKDISLDVLTKIEQYYAAIDENTGVAFTRRRQLENSMQQLNTATGKYFDLFKDELQIHYPCYFEKFRTDGIEYDIYIGQSIAPKRPFIIEYLYGLQAMQVQSMAAIANLTGALYPTLEYPLQTTQLIFVNSRSIDISFREDERRFDVEGAYNIRYQVIKKRIDKVRILDTGERLTQPGKIAIVYFNEEDIMAYKNAIKQLQAEDVLSSHLEELELEDLQGVSGLKALRIDVLNNFKHPLSKALDDSAR